MLASALSCPLPFICPNWWTCGPGHLCSEWFLFLTNESQMEGITETTTSSSKVRAVCPCSHDGACIEMQLQQLHIPYLLLFVLSHYGSNLHQNKSKRLYFYEKIDLSLHPIFEQKKYSSHLLYDKNTITFLELFF